MPFFSKSSTRSSVSQTTAVAQTTTSPTPRSRFFSCLSSSSLDDLTPSEKSLTSTTAAKKPTFSEKIKSIFVKSTPPTRPSWAHVPERSWSGAQIVQGGFLGPTKPAPKAINKPNQPMIHTYIAERCFTTIPGTETSPTSVVYSIPEISITPPDSRTPSVSSSPVTETTTHLLVPANPVLEQSNESNNRSTRQRGSRSQPIRKELEEERAANAYRAAAGEYDLNVEYFQSRGARLGEWRNEMESSDEGSVTDNESTNNSSLVGYPFSSS